MAIKLSPNQTKAWKRLEDQTTTEILYGSAAGVGKSYLGCIWHIHRRTRYPNTRGLIGRAKLTALKESTIVTLFKVMGEMGYKPETHYKYNAQDHTITWKNGSKTIFKDLFLYPSDPDFTSLGSTEFTDVFVDEVTEITQKAFEILLSRIRWMLDDYNLVPKALATCNPQPGWVKEKYISKDNIPVTVKPHQAVIASSLDDNPDQRFAERYRQQLENLTSNYDKLRLLYGDWEAAREVENPFAVQFDRSKHTGETEYDPSKQLYIALDFNVEPFACSFWQMWQDAQEHAHCIGEVAIQGGTIEKLANHIKSHYPASIMTCKMTGDYGGMAKRIGTNNNISLFEEIRRALGLRPTQMQIRTNPRHKVSREDVNFVLKHHPDFKIGNHCKSLILDFEQVQCDAYGEIIKKNRKNIDHRADFLDTARYFVNTFLAAKTGVYAWTKRNALRKVA